MLARVHQPWLAPLLKKLACPVPLLRRHGCGAVACAHDERDQRWCARQQQPRPARIRILPVGAPSLREALRYGARSVPRPEEDHPRQGMSTAVGDEGGFAPSVASHEAAIQLILEAIEKAGYVAGEQIALGLDCAASEFYKGRQVPPGRRGLDPDRSAMDRHAGHLVRQVAPSSPLKTVCTKVTGKVGRF